MNNPTYIILSEPTLALHKLVFLTVASSPGGLPFVGRQRAEQIANQYANLLDSIKVPSPTITPVVIGDETDIEAIESVTRSIDWGSIPKVQTVFKVTRLNRDLSTTRKDNKPSVITAGTIFNLYNILEKWKLKLPAGALRWMVEALPGDECMIWSSKEDTAYELTVSIEGAEPLTGGS